jgi:hypothetical protein
MKIKTAVFWLLWVGNDLTLQTIREQDPDAASERAFSARGERADSMSQTRPIRNAGTPADPDGHQNKMATAHDNAATGLTRIYFTF